VDTRKVTTALTRPGGRARTRLVLAACALATALAGGGVDPAAGGTSASKPTLLPQLVVLPSRDIYVGTSTTTPVMLPSNEVLYGCDPHETEAAIAASPSGTLTEWPLRCLRFDTMVVNIGTGRLELRYAGTGAVQKENATQRLYRRDDSFVDRRAGYFFFDPAHQHFHYANFAWAALWRSNSHGRRLGTSPVRTGRKDGFCLEDMGPFTNDAVKQRYTYPTACYPTAQSDGSLTQVNGISPGNYDTYDETLPNQSIVVNGVADGYYLLQITIDPQHTLLLDKKSRLTTSQLIRLCGATADLVGVTDNCAHKSASSAAPPSNADGLLAQHWRQACLTGWCPGTATLGFGPPRP
jgi:hypothetical protein